MKSSMIINFIIIMIIIIVIMIMIEICIKRSDRKGGIPQLPIPLLLLPSCTILAQPHNLHSLHHSLRCQSFIIVIAVIIW